MKFFNFITIVLLYISPILAGSTSVQVSSIPAKVDSQHVISQSQIFDSLSNKIERIETLLQKQVLQTVNTPKKENWWKENAGWVKDWANVLFFTFAILGTVATLLFNRKTLFNPLRTEIFKKQVDIYTDILRIIDDPLISKHSNLIFLNILSIINTLGYFKKEIISDDFLKSILNQKWGTLEVKVNPNITNTQETRNVLKYMPYFHKDNRGNF